MIVKGLLSPMLEVGQAADRSWVVIVKSIDKSYRLILSPMKIDKFFKVTKSLIAYSGEM